MFSDLWPLFSMHANNNTQFDRSERSIDERSIHHRSKRTFKTQIARHQYLKTIEQVSRYEYVLMKNVVFQGIFTFFITSWSQKPSETLDIPRPPSHSKPDQPREVLSLGFANCQCPRCMVGRLQNKLWITASAQLGILRCESGGIF